MCYRLTAAQHEILSLKQQLETANAAATDRTGLELNDKLNNLMTTLKADHEKVNILLRSVFSRDKIYFIHSC